MRILLAITLILGAMTAHANGLGGRKKVQEVNFEEMMMKGTIRNPDGSFLVQKKGLKFFPLYQVQKSFDTKIRESEPEELLERNRRTK
jgi:hypothetical protein